MQEELVLPLVGVLGLLMVIAGLFGALGWTLSKDRRVILGSGVLILLAAAGIAAVLFLTDRSTSPVSSLQESPGAQKTATKTPPAPTTAQKIPAKTPDTPVAPQTGLPEPPSAPEIVEEPGVEALAEARSLNAQGFRAYKKGNYLRARRFYTLATLEAPTYALAWYNLACIEAIRGDVHASLLALSSFHKLDPEVNLYARVHSDDDFEGIRSDPTFLRAIRGMQNLPGAVRRPAGEAASGDTTILKQAEEAFAGKRYKESKSLVVRYLELAPQSGPAWYLLAKNQSAEGNVNATVEALRSYQEHTPNKDLLAVIGDDDHFASMWNRKGFQERLREVMRQ